MAEPNWGMLTKAQDDSETIEQAIARLIAEHEASETSHLGVGESLEAHKNADVIDHPAGSLVGDKFSNQDFIFTPTFESLDAWLFTATKCQIEPGGFKLFTSTVLNNSSYLFAGADYSPRSFQLTLDTTFQISIALSSASAILAYALAGSNEDVGDAPGVGFKFLNGTVYGVIRSHSGGSYHETTLSIGSFVANVYHLYRVQVDIATGYAYFYIDSILQGSIALPADDAYGLALFSFTIKTTDTTAKFMFAGSPYLSIKAI